MTEPSDTLKRPAFNPDTQLENDNRQFSRNVLRVLRYVLLRIRAENRKSWKNEDLVQLLETLTAELGGAKPAPRPPSRAADGLSLTGEDTSAATGLGLAEANGAEDRLPEDREACIATGKLAFSRGLERAKNPFPEGGQQYTWWDTGWHDAERGRKVGQGDTVGIRRGRDLNPKKTSTAYKIQLKANSVVSEWNEPLHQYSADGQGTLFTDYDEVQSLADRLALSADGIITVIAVKR